MLFFGYRLDPDGNERRELRLVDYAPPIDMLDRMRAIAGAAARRTAIS